MVTRDYDSMHKYWNVEELPSYNDDPRGREMDEDMLFTMSAHMAGQIDLGKLTDNRDLRKCSQMFRSIKKIKNIISCLQNLVPYIYMCGLLCLTFSTIFTDKVS